MKTYYTYIALVIFLVFSSRCSLGPTATAGDDGGATIEVVAVRGTVVFPDGTPAKGASVTVRPRSYKPQPSDSILPLPDAIVQDDGTFHIDSLPPGHYHAEFRADQNFTNDFGSLLALDILDSAEQSIDTLHLEETGTISGTLAIDSTHSAYVYLYGIARFAPVNMSTGTYTLSRIPRGDYILRAFTTDPSYGAITVSDLIVAGDATVKPISFVSAASETMQSWSHQAWVSIQSPSETDTLLGFPLLMRFESSQWDLSAMAADGSDLRFRSRSGDPLPYEIESWETGVSDNAVWVRIDSLFPGENEQTFSVHWGASQAQDRSNGSAVFSAYTAVWHLNEQGMAIDGDFRNAVSTRYNGTGGQGLAAAVPYRDAGIAGEGQHFDGFNDHIGFTNTESFGNSGSFTVSAWVRLDHLSKESPDERQLIVRKKHSSDPWYSFELSQRMVNDSIEGFVFRIIDSEKKYVDAIYAPQSNISIDAWYHVVGVYDDNVCKIYVNGSSEYCTDSVSQSRPFSSDDILTIGASSKKGSQLAGDIDEVRFSSIARNLDWIATSYHTQRKN